MRLFGERIEMSNQSLEVIIADVRFETQLMLKGNSEGKDEVHDSSSLSVNCSTTRVSAPTAFPAGPAFLPLLPVQQCRSRSFERYCEKLGSAATSISAHPPIF